MSADEIAWSAPDERGISTAMLGKLNASSLRGRRLRRTLGLAEPDADLRAWQQRRAALDYVAPDLLAAARDLDSCAPKTALARADLLDALPRSHRLRS